MEKSYWEMKKSYIIHLIAEFVLTDIEFQDESELEELDFDESWMITENYPELQWQE